MRELRTGKRQETTMTNAAKIRDINFEAAEMRGLTYGNLEAVLLYGKDVSLGDGRLLVSLDKATATSLRQMGCMRVSENLLRLHNVHIVLDRAERMTDIFFTDDDRKTATEGNAGLQRPTLVEASVEPPCSCPLCDDKRKFDT
jgi:hypothetical protein